MQLLDTHLFNTGVPDELRHLINYISRAGKYIQHAIKTGDLGLAGTSNLFGENQLALDVLSDKIIEENLMICRLVNSTISEEKDEIVKCKVDGDACEAPYSVAYDPLDGSSLVNANLSIGSIFSIMKGKGFLGKTGRDQVAALFIVYGPRTTLLYSAGKGVHEFTLNDVGEFQLSKENLTIKETASHFAPGNLRAYTTDQKYKALVDDYIENQYTLRYSGGMVPDINHMFSKGEGIFMYPANPPKNPNGKLRLLFECNPFAYLVEQAGGASSNGEKSILDIEITELHQQTPIYVGSKKEVEKVVEKLK